MFPTLASFVLLVAFGASAQATIVTWYTTRTCDTPSQEYRVGCNTCVDPPFDWFAAAIADIGPNQRVSYHNQDKCTSKSQVGQWYGPGCRVAGKTALRSVWISCDSNRIASNATEEADAVEVADQD